MIDSDDDLDSLRALSPESVAKRLEVSHRTVKRMIRDGRLKAFWIGACVRIPISEIRRLLATAKVGE